MLSGVHTGMSPAPSSTIPRHTTSTPRYVQEHHPPQPYPGIPLVPRYVQVHHPPQPYPDIPPVHLDMYKYITHLNHTQTYHQYTWICTGTSPSSTIPRHTNSTPRYVQVHHPPHPYPDIPPVHLDMYRYITLPIHTKTYHQYT